MIGIVMGMLLFFFSQILEAAPLTEASGQLVNGFRVLSINSPGDPLELTVFRGDYIKFDIGTGLIHPVLTIPSMSVKSALIPDLEQAPYFKMKDVGQFDFSIGSLAGILTVVEYHQVNYEAVSAQQAQQVMALFNPMILDVRTPGEYAKGRLENSVLIPVQQLQARMDELAEFSDEPILIYCATGNRSTVASKILIDKGFTRIFNLRRGIADWVRNKYPIVK
jgi:rhodanese-related sulfurtransferase